MILELIGQTEILSGQPWGSPLPSLTHSIRETWRGDPASPKQQQWAMAKVLAVGAPIQRRTRPSYILWQR
jgi:hypothetical protein